MVLYICENVVLLMNISFSEEYATSFFNVGVIRATVCSCYFFIHESTTTVSLGLLTVDVSRSH
jgi:hypothetical protein